MESSTISIIIIFIAIISFVLERIPLAMTAMIASLAMGILIPEMKLTDVYTGFGSTTVMMVAGMMVIGDTLFRTGMATKIGKALTSSPIAKNERLFLIVITATATLMSAFLSNSGTIALFMPLIAAAALNSKGKIRNKAIVMSAGMGAAIGGGATLVGSTSQQVANAALMGTPGYEAGMYIFDMSKIMLPLSIVAIVYLGFIGYPIMKRVFDFSDEEEGLSEIAADAETEDKYAHIPAWKGYLSLAVILLSVFGFILTSFDAFKPYLNVGIVALIGATVLITTGCTPLKESLRDLDWNTILILGAAQGFAKGLDVSGGGRVIALAVLDLFGGELANPAILMAAGIFVTVVLTNFMSNTALAAMMAPIYIQIALQMGISPIPFVIAIAISTNIATATPVGTPCVTQTLPAGYRYMDYVKVGGPLTILLMILMMIFGPVFYPPL